MKRMATVCVLATLLSTGGARAETAVGIVSFTVDSLLQDFYQNRFPVFVEYGIPGTLYIQTQPVDTGPWGVDWHDLRDMHAKGWEIGAHSYTHEYDLTTVDDDQLELELGAPAAHIYREIGVYPRTFATPFGAYDERVLARARVYYDAHLGAWGNGGINPIEVTDHYRINRIEVEYTDTAESICAKIKQVGSSGDWLVLMLHTIVDGQPQEYQISAQTLEQVLQCTADLIAAGAVRVMTVAEALAEVPHTPK